MNNIYDFIILGASGFVGKNLVKFLKKKKYKVFSVNRNYGNLAKKKTWEKLPCAKILINLAAQIFSDKKESSKQIKTNLNIAINSLDFCRKNNIKMIFLSTYLYGRVNKFPTNEKSKIVYNNEYGLSKKLSEDLCKFYNKKYKVKILVIRPFNLYGPGQSDKFIIPTLLKQINKKKITILNNNFSRDFLHIKDFVAAIEKLTKIEFNFDTVNLGSGKSYSFKKIIIILEKLLKRKIILNIVNKDKNNHYKTRADIKKIKRLVNWRANISLFDGIKKLIYEYSHRRT